MSAEQPLNISQHVTMVQTLMEQYSQLMRSFDSRLTSLENSMKNCQCLIRQMQQTDLQLSQRVQLLENSNDNNNKQSEENNNNKCELEETELDLSDSSTLNDNINHNNNTSISPTSMPILEAGTEIEKENLSPSLVDDNNNKLDVLQLFGLESTQEEKNDNYIDEEVLFSSFESTHTLVQQAMAQNDFETALEHSKDAFEELNKYLDCDTNIDNIPQHKKHIVSVAVCNEAICFGTLKQFKSALIAINKCILIQPNWFKPYSTMGAIYALQKEYEKAINAYKKAMQLCQENDIHIDTRNKIQRRYKMVLDRMDNKNNNSSNNNKKRKLTNNVLDESPAKRAKYNDNYNINTDIDRRIKQIKDKLSEKTVSELGMMCDINGQKKSGRKNELIERVADGIIFGAMPRCPMCANKFLSYNKNTGYYKCNGRFDITLKKRVPCDFHSKDIQRKPWATIRKTT